MTVVKHGFGWKPELKDQRDVPFTYSVTKLPLLASMRSEMPPVYDQGEIGSCTANSIAANLDHARFKQGEPFITPSRLFIYYNERDIEGTVDYDAGAYGRDGIKSLKTKGVCPEVFWPYVASKLTTKPSAESFAEALKYQALTYKRVTHTSLTAIKAALSQDLPISFGFTVYESFEGDEIAKTGILKMPAKKEKVIGGHEVLAIGYDDEKQMIEVRNSWGKDWGDAGHFWMPYAYITSKLCSDFWVITSVE